MNYNKKKPTKEQRELLIRIHIANQFWPVLQDVIDIFEIDITKQSISEASIKRRKKEGLL